MVTPSMIRKLAITTCVALLAMQPIAASAFEFTFDWGAIPLSVSGNPNRVGSPTFNLSGVPAGTKKIKFALRDVDVPSYDHGGGSVTYTTANVPAGSFKYKSPCPPNGAHTYRWTATAIDAGGKVLGKASAKQRYPK